MKSERASAMETTKAIGDATANMTHPGKFDLIRLNPTKSGYKKIKSRPAVFPSAFIRVHLRLKFPFPLCRIPRCDESCPVVLKKIYFVL